MKTATPKEQGIRDEEKGIALIITLGILAILIVVALAFVASARTSRKAAATHASVTGARLIAESALEKITGLIRYYNTHNGDLKVTELASSYVSGDDVAATTEPPKQDWLYRIFSGGTDADKASKLTDTSGKPTVEWEYVKIDGKIVGRVGFTVEANGKVNPARIVDHSVKYPNSFGGTIRDEQTAQIRIGIETNEMWLGCLPNITSYVNTLSDFNSKAAATPGQLDDNGNWPDVDALCSRLGVTSATGKDKFKNEWFDTRPRETTEAFWVDDNDDGIVNADGTAADGGTDNDDEMYCRFNLRRYEDKNGNGVYDAGDTNLWNDLAQNATSTYPNLWASTTKNDSNDVEYLLQVPKRIDDTTAAPNDTGGIMWLSKWGITLGGQEATPLVVNGQTFYHVQGYRDDQGTNEQKVQYARHMMAANLIDYCDGDNVPTSNLNPMSWSGASWPNNCPQWYGREKVRYCNECFFECNVVPSKDPGPSGSGTQKNQYTAAITVTCETIDIYPGNLDDVDVYLTAKIIFTYKKADGSNGTKTYYYEDELIDGSPAATTNDDFITTLKVLEAADVFGDANYLPGSTPPEITSVDGCVYAVIIKNHAGGYGVDYHFGGHPVQNVSIKEGENKTVCWLSWNKDPRARSKYNRIDVTDDPTTLPYIPILGNNDKVPSPGHGKATPGANAAAPRDISTMLVVVDSANSDPEKRYMQSAFIRNDMMKSPWELGFIHRPSPFQTLNLGLFNETDTGVLDNKHMRSGGNLLDNERITNTDMTVPSGDSACPYGGDANILSQVKMQPLMSRFGIVDINTRQQDILKMLLSGITIGQRVDQMDSFSSGATLDSTGKLNQLVNNIISANGTFQYRSEVVNVPGLCDGTVLPQLDTSTKREEIVGKFINLIGTTSNTYRVIILAQSIKDVGGGATISKDLNYDGKINATGATDTYDSDGDAATSDSIDETASNTKLGQYDQMFDEITAEQKIAVDLAYDVTANQWRILKYEYLDD